LSCKKWQKMCWATFWAIFSQTPLVNLFAVAWDRCNADRVTR
jgi:hypothetical protein